jgi:hypothetical protein
MRLRSFSLSLIVLAAILGATFINAAKPASAPASSTGVGPVYCVGGTSTSSLCSAMPHDVKEGNGYGSILAPGTQQDFDNFSWQSFVALNWPADTSGRPIPKMSIGVNPTLPRVWDYYKLAEEVFLAGGAQPDGNYPSKVAPPIPKVCQGTALQSGERVIRGLAKIDDVLNIPDFFEEAAVDLPLIDRYGNFIVYQVAMNQGEFNDIYSKGWYNSANQKGQTIRFTPGQTGGAEGAIELKSAWRILQPGKDDFSRYFVRPMRVYVPAKHSATGKEFCTPTLQMGLTALHIVHKGAAQPDWIWSTFEHVDNAPVTNTPLPATATAASGPCSVPPNARQMSLFTPGCVNRSGKACIANDPPVQAPYTAWLWSAVQPYAKNYLTQGRYGTQVVRCSPVWAGNSRGPGTAWLNTQWQTKLKGTPFANYMLIGSQWQAQLTLIPPGHPRVDISRTPPAPPYIQNTAAETYLQNASSLGMSACMECHSGAQGAACEESDMSFMLDRAQPPVDCKKKSGHPLVRTSRSTMVK